MAATGRDDFPDGGGERFTPKPNRLPPAPVSGPVAWMRLNLFSNVADTVVTFGVVALIATVLWNFIEWGLVDAVWHAANRRECMNVSMAGACWAGSLAVKVAFTSASG